MHCAQVTPGMLQPGSGSPVLYIQVQLKPSSSKSSGQRIPQFYIFLKTWCSHHFSQECEVNSGHIIDAQLVTTELHFCQVDWEGIDFEKMTKYQSHVCAS
jgi:hypothetical protein